MYYHRVYMCFKYKFEYTHDQTIVFSTTRTEFSKKKTHSVILVQNNCNRENRYRRLQQLCNKVAMYVSWKSCNIIDLLNILVEGCSKYMIQDKETVFKTVCIWPWWVELNDDLSVLSWALEVKSPYFSSTLEIQNEIIQLSEILHFLYFLAT